MTSSLIEQVPPLKKLWQTLESSPLVEPEDSILLRVLVQLMVILGIIATDVAAPTSISFWAIPLSVAGAYCSWRRRRKRNVMIKFLLALAMIVLMIIFLAKILANLNDTRLVLAEFLIQLQVLHSFDLPRRKDLGYSMVIGLILMGVAGTVSQTLAFAPILLLFLLLALPTLILDYRSRLGLKGIPTWKGKKYQGNIKQASFLVLVTLSLGLIIFALMPRFPGYQLQTFPVSSPVDLEQEDLRGDQGGGIVNPGYSRLGEDQDGEEGPGEMPEIGPGQVNVTYYYGFASKINQNLRGQMTEKLVMRVRSQALGFWRVLAFDHYTGQGWEISREDELMEISRPSWSYRFTLTSIPTIAKTRQVVQTYTIVSDLPNLLPVLSHPQYLFFPTNEISLDQEGSIRSPFYLMEDLTYTVISQVPYRDRTLLGQASQDYSSSIKRHYLQIPPELLTEIQPIAESLLAKSPKPLTSVYEKALFLTQTLKQNYSIQPDLPFFEPEEDLVKAFLFKHQGGYPDHFGTVLTMLLRSIGIPARLAAGFAPGQFNPFTGYYLVHNTDAYALSEVYFPQYGWFAFDPVPGHEIVPPSFEQNQTFGVLSKIWEWVAGFLPSPVSSLINDLFSYLTQKIAQLFLRFWQLISGGIIGFLTALLILVSLAFLGWLGLDRLTHWRKYQKLSQLDPMERLYLHLLNFLQEKGYPKHKSQTPLEYADGISNHHQELISKVVQDICSAYVCWRYGDETPNIPYLQQQFSLLRNQFKIIKT